jgi:hypothetical protein
VSIRSFWPPAEAAQVDYEMLRGQPLEHGRLPAGRPWQSAAIDSLHVEGAK